MSRRANAKRKKSNKLSMVLISFVIMIFCGIMITQIIDMRDRQRKLIVQETQLQAQLTTQEQRTKDLEERKVYVQTKQYVEEAAGKLGYVYPDEVILKPEDK